MSTPFRKIPFLIFNTVSSVRIQIVRGQADQVKPMPGNAITELAFNTPVIIMSNLGNPSSNDPTDVNKSESEFAN